MIGLKFIGKFVILDHFDQEFVKKGHLNFYL